MVDLLKPGRVNYFCNITGITGPVAFDSNGDRISDYSIWHLPLDGDAYDFIDVTMTSSNDTNVSQ